jgi:hypothetical protein
MDTLLRGIATVVVLGAAAFTAQAATIDFSGSQGFNGNPLVLPNATINNLSGGTVLAGTGASSQADGFCFLRAGSCESDGEITFSSAVTNLTFDVDGADAGDSVMISAFNGVTLLGSISATMNGLLDFSGFGSITRLFFDDSSTSAGVGYSTFSFDTSTNGVPAPGTMPLIGLGIAGLAWVRRRRST